jgi:hypothetical protein
VYSITGKTKVGAAAKTSQTHLNRGVYNSCFSPFNVNLSLAHVCRKNYCRLETKEVQACLLA